MWLAQACLWDAGLQGIWISSMTADFPQSTEVEVAKLCPWERFPVALDSAL